MSFENILSIENLLFGAHAGNELQLVLYSNVSSIFVVKGKAYLRKKEVLSTPSLMKANKQKIIQNSPTNILDK